MTTLRVSLRFELALLAFLALACGAETPATERPPMAAPTAGTSESFTADFTDASGRVQVRIKTCPWSQPSRRNVATCSVDSEFALVGGGAEVEGNGAPGALLDSSYPNSTLSTWTASSKDHSSAYDHRLRAFAIGLKLSGVSVTTLRRNLTRVVASSASDVQVPIAAAEVPPGYTLISGGAMAHWDVSGLLLTKSYPEAGLVRWNAEAKAHGSSELGTVDAIAVGIRNPFPDFGDLDVRIDAASTDATGGYGTAQVFLESGYVASGIGGRADWPASGRLLTDVLPIASMPNFEQAGAIARSNDHSDLAVGGSTHAFVLGIRAF